MSAADPTRIYVEGIAGMASIVGVESPTASQPPAGEYVDAQSYDELLDAIGALVEFGHDGNDFVLSSPPVETARALEALHTRYASKTSPAPIDDADGCEEDGGVPPLSGAGGDQASPCGAGTAQAEGETERPVEDSPAGAPSASAVDGSTPPGDGASAGGVHMLPASSCPSWAQRFPPQSMRTERD